MGLGSNICGVRTGRQAGPGKGDRGQDLYIQYLWFSYCLFSVVMSTADGVR